MTDSEFESPRITSEAASDCGGPDSEATIVLGENHGCSEKEDSHLEFQEGNDVLAHWSDGLFYLGVISKVSADFRRCLVRFEDGSHYWCSFHHLQKATMPGADIVCSLCKEGRSIAPNEIVLCDNCNQGYHQKCHKPKISNKVLRPDAPWLCRKCVFATTARTGGAIKKGSAAQTLLAMKRSLPYNPKTLTWDLFHRTNKEECYCYCGGPGIWYMKMLKCARCFQWFHEACLQCMDCPLMNGDHLYVFVCCLCNSGQEFLHRLELTWLDIAHLVLFNLGLQNRKKLFELDSEILPFLNVHWPAFQLKGQISLSSEDTRRQNVLETLRSYTQRFKSGDEVKKRMFCFSLRTRLPPPVPEIRVPMRGQITHTIVEHLTRKEKDPNRGSLNSPSTPSKHIEERFFNGRNSEPGSSTCSSSSSQTSSFTSRNSKSHDVSDSEDASSIGTLDSIIPPPTNFEGANHPFWNLDPRGGNRKRRQRNSITDLQLCMRQHRKATEAKRMNSGNSIGLLFPETKSENLLEKRMVMPVSAKIPINDLKSSVSSFFGGVNRIERGEKFNVLAKRTTSKGVVQHLIEWEGSQ